MSEFSSAAATETSDMQLVPPTGAADSQHRICLVCGEAAALPNALGGAWPHTPKLRAEALHPNSGRKPTPTFSYDWRKT